MLYKLTPNILNGKHNNFHHNKANFTTTNHFLMNKHMWLTDKIKNSLLEIILKNQESSLKESKLETPLKKIKSSLKKEPITDLMMCLEEVVVDIEINVMLRNVLLIEVIHIMAKTMSLWTTILTHIIISLHFQVIHFWISNSKNLYRLPFHRDTVKLSFIWLLKIQQSKKGFTLNRLLLKRKKILNIWDYKKKTKLVVGLCPDKFINFKRNKRDKSVETVSFALSLSRISFNLLKSKVINFHFGFHNGALIH